MIRKAQAKDCLNLAALSIQVWLNAYAREGINVAVSNYVMRTFSEAHFQRLLARADYQMYVLTEQNNLLGLIALDFKAQFKSPDNGFEITTLYIQDRQQGKGLGSQLLQHVNGLYKPVYWLTTWSQNIEAIGFYQHLGFNDIGVSYFELDGEQHENRVLGYSEL
jgi:ribosomal protein S18 acetylase RimI-like enzyme